MKKQSSIALAAAALFCGVTVASAATMSHSANTMSSPAKASDTLNLSGAQQKTAWKDLTTPMLSQTVPSGYNPTIGAVLPKSVTTAPMPSKAASDVPGAQAVRLRHGAEEARDREPEPTTRSPR